jgi:integrase
MDLGGRLSRDGDSRWQLYYRGDQLKVDEWEGMTTEFGVPWPPELVEQLETYLRDYRPVFPNAEDLPHVFLTEQGRPFSQGVAWSRLSIAVYKALRKRLFPHLLRKIWTDAYMDAHPGDYEGAAAMLANTPQMVQAKYRRFRREQHLRKAVDFNAKIFGNGHGERTSR